MAKRHQHNIYNLLHRNGQRSQMVAANITEVIRTIHKFKMKVFAVQREPSATRTYNWTFL